MPVPTTTHAVPGWHCAARRRSGAAGHSADVFVMSHFQIHHLTLDDGACAQWLDGTVLPDGNWVLKGVALTRLSTVLNALVMAGLVWAGALSFKRVVRSDSAQLVYCMQARRACMAACAFSGAHHACMALMQYLESTT